MSDLHLKVSGEAPIISGMLLKLCQNHDKYLLDFLYRSRNLDGVIVNVEKDFNPHLGVTTFANSLKWKDVLVVCPNEAIVKWHYYFSLVSSKLRVLNPQTEFESDDESISITSIDHIKSLKGVEYQFVIIENFDEVATKLAIKKLRGEFNIGITYRNFYIEPDSKIVWHMLNWANTGCVGKLSDFYQIDNENVASYRDNYRTWWIRLTWKFNSDFVQPTLEERGTLLATLRKHTKENNLHLYPLQTEKLKRKATKQGKRPTKKVEIQEDMTSSDTDSDATIIYDINEEQPSENGDVSRVLSPVFEQPSENGDVPRVLSPLFDLQVNSALGKKHILKNENLDESDLFLINLARPSRTLKVASEDSPDSMDIDQLVTEAMQMV